MACKDYFGAATPAALEQMLNSRERRAKKQRKLSELYGKTLICLTLNIPGEYKLYPLAKRAFEEGNRAISLELQSNLVPVVHCQSGFDVTGCESYYCVDSTAAAIKSMMMVIENQHPLGRLFDIDVFDAQLNAIKGATFGRSERKCLICDKPVWECSRSRAHPAELLAVRTAEIIDDFFARGFADKVCRTAVKSLLYEVVTAPKPGLVDRNNSGSHSDMDIFTFLDSSCSLIPYFRDITLQSVKFEGKADSLLAELRYLGRCAEADMFSATSGVNTHKGLVFSMGIICAALGYIYGHDGIISMETLSGLCGEISGSVPGELKIGARGSVTHGQKAFDKYEITGARGEAAAGFPSARDIGYPVLKEYVLRGCTLDEAGAIALLHLIANVDDTNIVNRGDIQELRDIQTEVSGLLRDTDDPASLLRAAETLDKKFIRKNLSPGGSADILAVSLFFYWIL